MADKKISELPLITTISGSIVFVPIVHDGITEKITVEDFSKFTNKYAAQTGSVNIFTANQTITANLSVGGTSTLTGNTSIGGNLVVNGKLTAQELFTEITSASIIFESGSTIFGNSADDTHQFTGIVSINGTTIGAQALNDFTASTNNQLQRVYQTTSSLNIQTGSQDLVNLRISSTTGSINTTTSSFDSVFLRISSTTGSINTTTSSFDSVFLRISSTTGSINTTTSSFNSEFIKIGSTTSSIHFTTQSLNVQTGSQDNLNAQIGIATGSLNAFTGSVIGQTNTISTFTASVNFTTQSLNTQTGSQNSINFNISVVTSSIDAHILKQATQTGSQDLINYNLSVVTSSINAHILKQATQTGSQDLVNYNISVVTSSIDAHILKQATQTGSQDLVNYQNSIITSSYRIELNSIEAYTSSLKSAIIVNGSNVQIVGELDVARLNVQYVSSSVAYSSGSNVFGDASNDKHEFTGSVAVSGKLAINDSATNFLIEGNGFSQTYLTGNGTIVLNPGFGGVEMVGSYRTFKATDITADGFVSGEIRATNNVVSSSNQITELFRLMQATASLNTQTGSQDLVNLAISTATGSLIGITNELMSYTASLKGQAIVSSSQQIKNYIEFVNNSVTSSMNVNSASIAYKATNVVGSANRILFNNATDTTTTSANLEWNGSTLAVNGNISFGYGQTLQSSLDPTNNISLHDGSFGVIAIRNGGTDRITSYRTTDTIKLSGSLVVDANSLTAKHQITGSVEVNGSITGSLLATNGIVSSSQQIQNYFTFAPTSSANTFYGVQTFNSSISTAGVVSTSDIRSNSGASDGQVVLSKMGGSYYGGGVYYAGDNGSSQSGFRTGMYYFGSTSNYVIERSTNTQSYGNSPTALTYTPALSIGLGTGDVAVSTGNLSFASGKGIDFSATSNGSGTTSSELLNDYEEGTWTPVIRGSGTAGTYELSTDYTTYTKIGRQVTLTGQLNLGVSITGGGSGYLQITGAPFTKAANTVACGTVRLGGVDFTGNYVTMAFTSVSATTDLFLSETVDNGANIDLPISAIAAGDNILFSITYFV
jgi:hypothetical protein